MSTPTRHIPVLGLTGGIGSGKSGSVTGNLSFEYSGGGCETGRFQFSVEDKTVRVFALGASKDVL